MELKFRQYGQNTKLFSQKYMQGKSYNYFIKDFTQCKHIKSEPVWRGNISLFKYVHFESCLPFKSVFKRLKLALRNGLMLRYEPLSLNLQLQLNWIRTVLRKWAVIYTSRYQSFKVSRKFIFFRVVCIGALRLLWRSRVTSSACAVLQFFNKADNIQITSLHFQTHRTPTQTAHALN
jgi:hypothetical protein